jgi:hypothetical protein
MDRSSSHALSIRAADRGNGRVRVQAQVTPPAWTEALAARTAVAGTAKRAGDLGLFAEDATAGRVAPSPRPRAVSPM